MVCAPEVARQLPRSRIAISSSLVFSALMQIDAMSYTQVHSRARERTRPAPAAVATTVELECNTTSLHFADSKEKNELSQLYVGPASPISWLQG
jgi:hypothetical protein